MSDGAKIALALAGVAVLAGVGYYVYQSQASSQTAAGGGASIGGATSQSLLGPGGSGTAIGGGAVAQGTLPDGTTINYQTSTATGPSASTAPPVTQSYEAG